MSSRTAVSSLDAVVLAAGQGKRMRSALPKVLHPICGRPLVHFPVRAALEAGASRVVVVVGGAGRAELEAYLAAAFGDRVTTAVQAEPRGTGDAARAGLEAVEASRVLVLCGDAPLLALADLERVVAGLAGGAPLAFLTCVLDDPRGFGRVLRGPGGAPLGIREERDLGSDAERAIREINAGVYAAQVPFLRAAVAGLQPNNAQGELYLTDVVAAAAARGGAAAVVGGADAVVGVNDRAQLAAAEDALYREIAHRHALAGVTVRGDARIDDGVEIGPDATVEAATRLRGRTRIGAGAVIDVGCVLTDAEIGPGATLLPYSVVTESVVGEGARIGPFAHLRPGSVIEAEAHVGNFVETKQTRLRRGAKANHLAYLGDGEVGEGANVGAGTIFCNYDGFAKHRTVIGAGAFIGSDSQLVAPVTIGEGAYVATGTTVTADVPADALAIGRTKQENKLGYASRLRARLRAAAKR
ncbi:MAG: bifunctional UDP-N-acetylglucosamine diphosphorylase/glucosamine-1-phosphate N-acetyltransferase GlmU [Polyangiaceae bacterium]|nr:bifunctional UDP-N-acetylglucosamine diphosphorylase/glucosamine-1-phosphate N-acetyltransferase GlmU [Polyangiaceae bacterium]